MNRPPASHADSDRFALDPTLRNDTRLLLESETDLLLLMNDQRWPWLILVPRQANCSELHHLAPALRQTFTRRMDLVSRLVQESTQCQSVNIGMLGNVVAQLHCHVIARNSADPNWPRPVWGVAGAEPYPNEALPGFASQVVDGLRQC